METYLKTHYGYTLQLLRSPVADPLANFLFERKQGHCEYFASSMAVMLRTLRIPSRVVNGFRSDEFNDVTGNYVVRAKNAHSWVEAYFPGYGWITFDPTPGGEIGTPEGWDRAMLYLDAAESFWREWVISYDFSHQYILGQGGGKRNARIVGANADVGPRAHMQTCWTGRGEANERRAKSPARWLGGLGSRRYCCYCWPMRPDRPDDPQANGCRRIPSDHRTRRPRFGTRRMARHLARRGVKKSSAQTPQEFVQDDRGCSIADAGWAIHRGIRIRAVREFFRRRAAAAGVI